MKRAKLTYKQAGVDIDKAESLIAVIKKIAATTDRPGVLRGIGSFGGFFSLNKLAYKNPVLVSSSDGVGTKLKIAFLADKHDTVGIDLVAMNVNDILCSGAEPLFFLDYLGCSHLDPRVYTHIIKGIAEGCRQAGCALIGGETAEMPGMYPKGEYDLAGFAVGIAEKGRIIDGSRIAVGDCVIGIASSGLHSNGFSLVRKVLSRKECIRHAEELLAPTKIYVKPVLRLLKNKTITVKGIAHVTGGAFYEKIKRIIPQGKAIEIDTHSWQEPRVFGLLRSKAAISDEEMYRTFNMGIGMVVVVSQKHAAAVLEELAACREKAWVIGEVVKGSRRVILR